MHKNQNECYILSILSQNCGAERRKNAVSFGSTQVAPLLHDRIADQQPADGARTRRSRGGIAAVVALALAGLTIAAPARADFGDTAARFESALMRDFGWTAQQAIGAVASLAHESRLRGIQQLGGGPGFGVAQWTGARRQAFMAWSSRAHLEPHSEAANLGFLLSELHTNFAHVALHMRGARTTSEAVMIFAREYEGATAPGAIAAMASRRRWAAALEGRVAFAEPAGTLAAATPSPMWQARRRRGKIARPRAGCCRLPTHVGKKALRES